MPIARVSDEEIKKQFEYMEKVKVAVLERYSDPKYAINTMGCKLNEADSEKISGMLEKMGYSQADTFEEAKLKAIARGSTKEKKQ